MSRWRSLAQLRADYAAGPGIALQRKDTRCKGKVRHGTPESAEQQITTCSTRDDPEHPARLRRLHVYFCRWCRGYHVGHYR